MKKIFTVFTLALILVVLSCKDSKQEEIIEKQSKKEIPFIWKNANLYFLLTDRFYNGNDSNDINFERTSETAILRGFEGGDIQGITQKIKEGYFTDLGINAIWLTPVVEQIHGGTDEGTGFTYGFHGYWTKDWTALDPNFGTKEDLGELVTVAHKNGIRIVLDAVINHTGPVTEIDKVWPSNWVRTSPKCEFNSYETSVPCALVENLPDILTESNENVSLPEDLINKWKAEGRYEQEIKELDEFFERTGYPRAPRFYIMKWLTDFILDFGIDGYRADTVRHIEESVWSEFKNECEYAFDNWKKNNPDKVLDNNKFYMVGEVYGYEIITAGKTFDFGDKKVNYYANGFDSMINFEFKKNAIESYEKLFSKYSQFINNNNDGIQVLNYLTSHDDSGPFDKNREKPYETGTKLLLSPGTAQVYYGDESARSLVIEGANGDATLRSKMNWSDIKTDDHTQAVLSHWQKLGKFRKDHPSIGAGIHKMINETPYVFSRTYNKDDFNDAVVIGLDLPKGNKEINVSSIFKDGELIIDKYSNIEAEVKNGKVIIPTEFNIVLLELK
jgi:alpha-amylase